MWGVSRGSGGIAPWGLGIAIVLVGLIARVAQKRSLSGAGNKNFDRLFVRSFRFICIDVQRVVAERFPTLGATLKRQLTFPASIVRSFTVVALVKYGRFFIQC
jgi:hypothetical protein